MSKQYVVQRGDTLKKIAESQYGDGGLFAFLAAFNGIRDPNIIRIGQTIEIPAKRQLEGGGPIPSSASVTAPPRGLDQILETFGNIYDFIRDDGSLSPKWEETRMSRVFLPFAIPLSWDNTKSVSSINCHDKIAGIVKATFQRIEADGLRDKVKTFGGCFNYRSKRQGAKLSTHSWGIAIDLNPDSNPQGKPGDMHPGVVQIFRDAGFTWGGDWAGKSKDPMHFQYCRGY